MSSDASATEVEDGVVVTNRVPALDSLPISSAAVAVETNGSTIGNGNGTNGEKSAGNAEGAPAKKGGRGRGKRGRSADSLLQEEAQALTTSSPRARETRKRKVCHRFEETRKKKKKLM